jgi:hypothetical protein
MNVGCIVDVSVDVQIWLISTAVLNRSGSLTRAEVQIRLNEKKKKIQK